MKGLIPGLSLVSVSLVVVQTVGCSRAPEASRPTESVRTDNDGVAMDLSKHNYTSGSVGEWSAELWMSGTRYRPWDPIDITLRLTTKKTPLPPAPEVMVAIELIDQKTGEITRKQDIRPTFVSPKDKAVSAWESHLADVFQSDMRQPHRKPGAAQLSVGDYWINILSSINKTTEWRIEKKPIKVEVREGH